MGANYPDETGWRVGGHPAWLWAFTTRHETVFAIERGRGYAEAALILGEQYAGVIGADGWAAWQFPHRGTAEPTRLDQSDTLYI